jgi:hypothetical protein
VATATLRTTQPELTLPDSVSQFDASDRHARCRHGLEAVHSQASSLDGPTILLNDVVQVAVGSNLDVTPEQGFAAQDA